MKTKLFVGNLSATTTKEDLNRLFSQAGSVVSVELLSVGSLNNVKNFAFVEMESRDQADQAVHEFNRTELHKRTIKVNLARPREARPTEGGWYKDPHPKPAPKVTSRRKSV